MSDELFKALVVIGIFVLPLFIVMATDRLVDHDPEPNWVGTLKGLTALIPVVGLIFGISSLVKALF
tara:strand:- start:745 stop:942 length:198 start_codon:yes stop_codon:yes gene_type:complete